MLADPDSLKPNAQTVMRTDMLNVSAAGKLILHDINVDLRRGEIFSIIGPAGAGKTTFLRSLNRMNDFEPELKLTGQVFLEDRPVYHNGMDVALLRRKVGMVFSVPNPLPMTIYENITFGIALAGLNKKQQDQRVEQALVDASLWNEVKDRLCEPARNLSGGQQQRMCLARALALKPDVLLLDEPCSGLDPISTVRIEETLHQLKEKLAILLVTNNVKQAARTADRTAFFLYGEVVELKKTDELFTTPGDKRTADYISGRFG